MCRLFFIVFLMFFLNACMGHKTITTFHAARIDTPNGTHLIKETNVTRINTLSETGYLQEGKRLFNGGYYKRAMRVLLPLAADNDPEAQYAVGYMFYYGYGVAQDPDIGNFWIMRSARQQFPPAIAAYHLINKPVDQNFHLRDQLAK